MYITLLSLALFGCEDSKGAADTGVADADTDTDTDTDIDTDTDTDTDVTWSNGISDIFQDNCVRCHASERFSTYAPLQTYAQVTETEQLAKIIQKIQFPPGWGTQMPPYPGGEITGTCEPENAYNNDLRMSDADLSAVLDWVARGSPEGSGEAAEPLVANEPGLLPAATEYPFDEGYVMTIGEDDDDGHRDDWICVIVDPGVVPGGRYLSGIQINSDVQQVFRGAVVWLDKHRESLAYVQADSPRDHGDAWYDCDEGFGFEGDILAGFLPEGEPIVVPSGAAVEVPDDALVVYKVHYHAHYDHVNPTDTGELPTELEWPDQTSLSLQWEDAASVSSAATLVSFGNYDTDAAGGTGSLTAPFLVPARTRDHLESMVALVPGTSDDTFAVWAVQPELGEAGTTVAVSVSDQSTGLEECRAMVGLVPIE